MPRAAPVIKTRRPLSEEFCIANTTVRRSRNTARAKVNRPLTAAPAAVPLARRRASEILVTLAQRAQHTGAAFDLHYLRAGEPRGRPLLRCVRRATHRALRPLRLGDFREAAGYLDLGQELAADAAVNLYSLADLQAILPRLGNRGYRAAQLEAAIEGGKLYLAAYALGLGATGLTFFDDDVTHFFSPSAAGKSVMFLTAIGRPARRRAAQ